MKPRLPYEFTFPYSFHFLLTFLSQIIDRPTTPLLPLPTPSLPRDASRPSTLPSQSDIPQLQKGIPPTPRQTSNLHLSIPPRPPLTVDNSLNCTNTMSPACPTIHHQETNKTFVFSADMGVIFGYEYDGERASVAPHLLMGWRKNQKIKVLVSSPNGEKESSPWESMDLYIPSRTDSSNSESPADSACPLAAAESLLSSLCSLSFIHQSCLCTSDFRSLTEISSLRSTLAASSPPPPGRVPLRADFALEVDISSFRKLFYILVHARGGFAHLRRRGEGGSLEMEKCRRVLAIIFWSLSLLKVNLHRFIESQASPADIGISVDDLKLCCEPLKAHGQMRRAGRGGGEEEEEKDVGNGLKGREGEEEDRWDIEREMNGNFPCFSEVVVCCSICVLRGIVWDVEA